ncbi:hypothetical protein HDU92_008434 [Lobulomyces angularis]|nr:hypothetical protein HDU92_008434 [Lobulomyces angularis]
MMLDALLVKCLWLNCSEKFESELEAYEHCFNSHCISGKQTCQWLSNPSKGPCLIKIQHRGQLKDHLITFPNCPVKVRTRQNLTKHFRVAHRNKIDVKKENENFFRMSENSEESNEFSGTLDNSEPLHSLIDIPLVESAYHSIFQRQRNLNVRWKEEQHNNAKENTIYNDGLYKREKNNSTEKDLVLERIGVMSIRNLINT